jgi:hypothetical protein
MGRVLRCVVIALLAVAAKASAQADASLQAILQGLTQGEEVTLVTPLANGLSEVTSFRSPVRLSGAQAAGALERARQELAALGVPRPSGLQLATALFGGTVDIPSGSTQLAGVLPGGPRGAGLRSQVVASGALPQAGTPSAASGGTMGAADAYATQLAVQQLAMHGIVDPTPEQIQIALYGGTIAPPSGPLIIMPGVLNAPGQPQQRRAP